LSETTLLSALRAHLPRPCNQIRSQWICRADCAAGTHQGLPHGSLQRSRAIDRRRLR